MSIIKVGYLISYDYEFVKTSLPRVYDHVGEIFFAVDVDGKTWSGQNFHINDEFWEWVKTFDTENKITIYKDKFFVDGLSAMECDTRERNMLSKQMGSCDWYIQIDSDEYFVDFNVFIQKLNNYKPTQPTTIYCRVATLFKQLPSGYLIIGEAIEQLSFATNNPVYNLARNNTTGNKQVEWNDLVLHQSWARTPEEIRLKLNNWSHKDDFNTTSFYNLWNAIDEFNYYCLTNFHPLNPATWPKLIKIEGSMTEMLDSEEVRKINDKPVPDKKRKKFFSRLWKRLKNF